MDNFSKREPNLARKFFSTLWKHGPLVSAKHVNEYLLQSPIGRIPGSRGFLLSTDKLLCAVQRYLDRSFDRKYGVDTSGIVPLKELTIRSTHIEEGIWYQPMQVKMFKQIMDSLPIHFEEYTFIDFGSGKGRVLLLASEYGYTKIIGVEFAKELHHIATQNVFVYNHLAPIPAKIETICMDAVKFPLPDSPVVLFFFSPFKGKVMDQVLSNVSKSITLKPRKFAIVFHGSKQETINLLHSTPFRWRELELRPGWGPYEQYRTFISTSQKRN